MTDDTKSMAVVKKTLQQLGYALVLGMISGFIGLCFAADVFCLIGTFGGMGLLLVYIFRIGIILPFLHCIYAYLIIRFRLYGTLFVMFFHYISAILATLIWIKYELPPSIWTQFTVAYNNISNPIFGSIIIMEVIVVTIYNGILLYLFWRMLKNKHSIRKSVS